VLAHPRKVIVAALGVTVLCAAAATTLNDRLSTGGLENPASESAAAATQLQSRLHIGTPNMLMLVRSTQGGVDDPRVRAAGLALVGSLANHAGVQSLVSYWTQGAAPPLRSADGHSALIVASLAGSQNQQGKTLDALVPEYQGSRGPFTISITGYAEGQREGAIDSERDLVHSDLVIIPLSLLLLILVFRSVIAALLPILVGVVAIFGSLAVLRLLTNVTEVSVFAVNMTTSLGLGLAIDYSLLLVARYRRERAAGVDVHGAVARAMGTAGRAVAVSCLIVAASVATMLVFPLAFLRSFAYAGIGVVLVAGAAALLVLPAVILVLGDRIERLSIRQPEGNGPGRWYRIARVAMRRPVLTIVLLTAVLITLALPFAGVRFALPDNHTLPKDAPAQQALDVYSAQFHSNEGWPILAVAPGSSAAQTDRWAVRVSELAHVVRVDTVTGSYAAGARRFRVSAINDRYGAAGAAAFSIVDDVQPYSLEAQQLIHQIRAVPHTAPVLVGGTSAELVDTVSSVGAQVPLALGLVALATIVILFAAFRSVLIPLKALLMNTLSLTAMFGAMVWIFQDGHLSTVLGFNPSGTLDLTIPILMFCVGFGLSMDYEVFLVSAIREAWSPARGAAESIAIGLDRSARVISAAAAILATVFLITASSSVSLVKLFGIGLALAVLVDATVVRGLLVPAVMRLAGEANWWAPRWLRRRPPAPSATRSVAA
jgi:RND superfamily putative drug exporter